MSLKERTVRYDELKACMTAFIDTRSPGSDKKENFTIIGPGVAENPEQHVHIGIPHGFNIGGARQPAGCLNSQHSHLTEEVFLVHTGKWDFMSGVAGKDGRITLSAGDVISIPTDIFRGFECIEGLLDGQHKGLGYLHAVLGKDDPGRVLWTPDVFDLATEYGLVLLADGSLVDTNKGQTIPDNSVPMPVTSKEQIATHRIVNSKDLIDIVLHKDDFSWQSDTLMSQFDGVEEASLVGLASPKEHIKASKLNWSHGFVMRAVKLQSNALIQAHTRSEEEVIFVHKGSLTMKVDNEAIMLSEGDNFSTPIGSVRDFENTGKEDCIVYITRRGDVPEVPTFI
ncbi:cupin domain-containing protein [Brumicola pallidula]|jgi:quercetin dioxygenase-like cupin family protein|uniref:Cupin domain protein n=1 Tax=Brumicola pallidula DSM 14239 = ACAM 615 TaxID=1121922 RepID=K6YTE2_9ALTE|nr:cupin domain-containing protein [Glaciecola pallidula]GAC27231.1 cupin domain protein [Glaciecola pallidula DSM 14239 = ACAM 615]